MGATVSRAKSKRRNAVTLGAPSKRARKIRKAAEFDSRRLQSELRDPQGGRALVTAWTLEQIFQAREQQLLGNFALPARAAEQMRTDDALFVAYSNRLAPQRCIPVRLEPAPGARGGAIANEAQGSFGQGGVSVRPETLNDIEGCLVNFGVAFGVNVWIPREDGSRVDVFVRYFPIEYVRWDSQKKLFVARCDPDSLTDADREAAAALGPQMGQQFLGGIEVPIVHGDGRWIVFANHEVDPFRQDAAILSALLVWARHAYACRDWAKGSVAHGNAKVLGKLPAGVPLGDADGNVSAEAAAMLELLKALASADCPVGIAPSGADVQFLTNTSTAWQVWAELVTNAEKAAARIYLGTDGTLGSQGGAPGVDVQALFGVATTKVRGDLECIERGLSTGVIEPWTAINFGDSALAPKRTYCIPNEELEADRKAAAERNTAFANVLKTMHDAGVPLAPAYVAALAASFGAEVPVFPAPAAPAAGAPALSGT